MDGTPWYRDADQLRAALAEHGSIRRVAAATGAPRSTLQEWVERHAIPLTPSQPDVKWGEGRPQLVKPATRDAWERVVFLSDYHAPYQDRALELVVLDFLAAVDPHRVVLNGDLCDFFALSRFNRSHEREDELQADIDDRNEFVARIREACPGTRIDETEGNHDHRIRSFVAQNAKPLHSLRALQPQALFRHKELDVCWHPGCGFLLRPNFLVKHGDKISALPGGTARAEAMANLCSGISGHAHRAEQWRKVGTGGLIEWTVTGAMCRMDPDYVKGAPNWTQGIAYGEFSTRSSAFHVQHVPYLDGALIFGVDRFRRAVAA